MPKFNITYTSNRNAPEAFKLIRQQLATDSELLDIDPSVAFAFNDRELKGEAKGKKFSAQLSVRDLNQGSAVELKVDIPLILTPLKSLIETTLTRKLKTYLA